MDGPVRDKLPNIDPTKPAELPPKAKPEKPPLAHQDKLTEDLADDFFTGVADLFDAPANLEEKVQITRYDPSLPVSSNYAEKVMNSLANAPLKYEKVGVMQRAPDGSLVAHKMKDQGDVEEHKRIQEGQIIFKHVGNAVRLIMSEVQREKLGKAGIDTLKQDVSRFFSTDELPNPPVEVTTLKTKDWETKVPEFFSAFAGVMPSSVKQGQQQTESQTLKVDKRQETIQTATRATKGSSKKERPTEAIKDSARESFPESPTKRIRVLEEKLRQHDRSVREAGEKMDKALERRKELDDKRK